MGNKLYVGNLSWGVGTDELRNLFAEYGTITDAIVLEDRETGRSRGFGFVTFETGDQAKAAIQALDGADVDGRNIKVNEAQERTGGAACLPFRVFSRVVRSGSLPSPERPLGIRVSFRVPGSSKYRTYRFSVPLRRWPLPRPCGFPSTSCVSLN
jgi:RNA recognition motif-containing protein